LILFSLPQAVRFSGEERAMKETRADFNWLKFWSLWVFVTALAWVAGQYLGFPLRTAFLISTTQISSLATALCLNGAILGSIVGLFQWLILRLWRKKAGGWLLSTLVGYTIGFPMVFVATVGLVGFFAQRSGLQLFSEGSGAYLFMPLAPIMILTGVVIALAQWLTIRRLFPKSKPREVILWVAGTALGWGMGFWAAAYVFTMGLSWAAQNAIAGGVIGVVTGAILVLFLSQPFQPESLNAGY